MKISLATARKLIKLNKLNTEYYSPEYIRNAIEVEFEHRDVIGDDPAQALKIVLAHLREAPDYYQRLDKMEASMNKYWSKHTKPPLFEPEGRPT